MLTNPEIRAAILDGEIDKALKYISTYYPHVLERAENRDIYFKLRRRKFVEMMRRSNEMGTTSPPAPTSKAFGKLSERDDSNRGLDQQMDLDGQLQQGSHPPTIPPVSMPAPLDPNILGPENGAADDSMDTSPDLLKPATLSKSNTSNKTNLLNEALDYGRELNREFSSDPRPWVKQALQDTYALVAYTDARDSSVGWLMDGKGRVEIAEEVNAAILGTTNSSKHDFVLPIR